jgi:hypothetical protein
MSSPLRSFEIVAARYKEDVSWLKEYSTLTTLYNKGPDDLPPSMEFKSVIQLPNIGREAHTYLYHIVHNYDSLAETTFFTQGHIQDHIGPITIPSLLEDHCRTSTEEITVFNKHGLKQFSDWDQIRHVKKWLEEYNSGTLKHARLSPSEFWKWMFDVPWHPEVVMFSWGALLVVKRDVIRRRERAFYKHLLAYFEGIGHFNPEEGHYMERFWLYVFGARRVGVVCADGEGEIVVKSEVIPGGIDSGYVSEVGGK